MVKSEIHLIALVALLLLLVAFTAGRVLQEPVVLRTGDKAVAFDLYHQLGDRCKDIVLIPASNPTNNTWEVSTC